MSSIDLPVVKAYLGKVQNLDDAAVPLFIDAAEAAIETRCGPLVQAPVTSVVASAGGRFLVLPVTPVVSVSTVTGKSGEVVAVEHVSAASMAHFDTNLWEPYYTVSYVAGWAANAAGIPPDLQLAVCELVRHLWMTQRGQSVRGPDSLPGGAWALPQRVAQLIAPYRSIKCSL